MSIQLELTIDIAQLKRVLQACTSRVEALDREREVLLKKINACRQLLDLEAAGEVNVPAAQVAPTGSRTIADRIADVLSTVPAEGMHGHKILVALTGAGHPIGGNNPKATLFSTLKRNANRFERVPRKPNTWRLKRAVASTA